MRRRSSTIAVPLVVLGLGLWGVGAWLARGASGPTAAIETVPPNPAAGQEVILRDASRPPAPFPGSWWDFGDGESSEAPSPVHTWETAGEYVLRLVSPSGAVESPLVVSAPDTLRLLAAHPFEVSLQADGEELEVLATAWTDRQGSFGFPQSAAEAGHPLVTVKVLESPDGRYEFFWSGMTSLEYTLTIREL